MRTASLTVRIPTGRLDEFITDLEGKGSIVNRSENTEDVTLQYSDIESRKKTLEALGFELPKPDKPLGRYNNRKITFDAACRTMLFEIARRHGLELDEVPEYGGRAYLEKQDYIMAKQKEQLAQQEKAVQEQTVQLEKFETGT